MATGLRPQESHEHLLSPRYSVATSSRPPSVYSTSTIDTVLAQSRRSSDAISIAPSTTSTIRGPQPYRGFPTRAAYLAALQEFADSKTYHVPDKTLTGWYGPKTMEELIEGRPTFMEERRVRKAQEREWRRRVTVQQSKLPESISEEALEESSDLNKTSSRSRKTGLDEDNGSVKPLKDGTFGRRLSRVFSGGRRNTVV